MKEGKGDRKEAKVGAEGKERREELEEKMKGTDGGGKKR